MRLCDECRHEFGEWCTKHDKDLWPYMSDTPDFCEGGFDPIMVKVAIINLKGGVGKSVTTINLAAEFSARSLQVLVVDLDKQANATKFYNALDYDKPSTADILTCTHGIAYTMQATDARNVELVPGNMRLLAANKQVLLDTTEPQQIRLRDSLEQVQDLFDICLMDCPPDLDMGSINAGYGQYQRSVCCRLGNHSGRLRRMGHRWAAGSAGSNGQAADVLQSPAKAGRCTADQVQPHQRRKAGGQ